MEGTKKLIEGSFRNASIELLKDIQWEFTEKIDGTNIRIIWDGHKITFGGRTERAQLPTPLIEHLQDTFLNNEVEELFEQKFGESLVTLVGEGYGGKIQSGSLYQAEQLFILFDIQHEKGFFSREAVDGIAKMLNIPSVPVVFTGTINEGIDYVKGNPNCTVAKEEKVAEGLVGRPSVELTDNRGNRVIVKIKACDFVA